MPEGFLHLPSLASVSTFGNEGGHSGKERIGTQVKVPLFLLSGSWFYEAQLPVILWASFPTTVFSKGAQYSTPKPGRAMGFQYTPSWLQNMLPSGNKTLEGGGEEDRVAGFEIFSRKYWGFFFLKRVHIFSFVLLGKSYWVWQIRSI